VKTNKTDLLINLSFGSGGDKEFEIIPLLGK
jgi:hypothetical protein